MMPPGQLSVLPDADKSQHHHHLTPPSSSRHVSPNPNHPKSLPAPPPPPSPPPDSTLNLDKRPSTAPGPQNSRAKHDLLPLPQTTGFKATRAHSVRKSPTISDLHIPKRTGSRRLSSANPPPSLSSLLSPTDIPPPVRTDSLSATSSRSRSTSARRPPASFSANGIETSYGPPPALITRNPYHSELARLVQNPAASTFAAQQQKSYNSSTFPLSINTAASRTSNSSRPQSRGRTSEQGPTQTQGLLSPTSFESQAMDSLDAIMQRNRRAGISSDQSFDISPKMAHRDLKQISDEGMESSQSSEDLFLKLANESSRQQEQEISDVTGRLDQLQIRGRAATERISLNTEVPYSSRRNSSPPEPSPMNRYSSQQNRSAYRGPSGAASVVGVPTRTQQALTPEQRLASARARYNGPQTPSVVSRTSDTPSYSQRRASIADQLTGRPHSQRMSRLNYTPTPTERSPQANRTSFQQDHRADGESVVSTVPSNVWDEMQELKSHVNRVDHNRGYSGQAGSNGSGERPRTATTTVTTVSSSPKVSMGTKFAGDGKVGGPDAANLHPNLHQSLARCKTLVNPAIYRALESAASEALEMAVSARSSTAVNGSIYSSTTGLSGIAGDRQMKRKADNICRNLTDLCVALIDGHGSVVQEPTANRFSAQSIQQRRASISSRAPTEVLTIPPSRHMSLEPEDRRPGTSRALERVEARRVSLMGTNSTSTSPREPPQPTQQRLAHQDQPKSSPIPSSFLRSGTSLLRTRRAQVEDDDDLPSARAPSRAVTEVGAMLRKRSDRVASGLGVRNAEGLYTSQQPLPQSNALRRVTGGGFSSPISSTASLLRGSSRFLGSDRLSTGDGASEEDEKKMKRRSFGLYTPPSSSTVPSRTLSLRPASLSAKRASLTTGE